MKNKMVTLLGVATLWMLSLGCAFASMEGVEEVTKIVVDGESSFLLKNGHVFSWGRNEYGQLGNSRPGGLEAHSKPRMVPGLSGVTDIQMVRGVSCALARGALLCWGKGFSASPQKIQTQKKVGPITAFGLSYWGTCFAGANEVTCLSWLGLIDKTPESSKFSEVEIKFLEPIKKMVLAGTSLCVLAGEQIYCGAQIYKPENAMYFKTPIFGDRKFADLFYRRGQVFDEDLPLFNDLVYTRFCGRLSGGAVYCVPDYRVYLENGSEVIDLTQIECFGDGNLKCHPLLQKRGGATNEEMEVEFARGRACAVREKQLYCWFNGQKMNAVDGLSDVVSVAVAESHVCAVTGRGVFCFGSNEFGQLGSSANMGLKQDLILPQKIEDPAVYGFDGLNLKDTFGAISKIAVTDKARVFEQITKALNKDLNKDDSLKGFYSRRSKFEKEAADVFSTLVISPLMADFAPELGEVAGTELEGFYLSYQFYLQNELGFPNGIPDLSVVPFSNPVAAAAREMLDASLRALAGVSGEANVEAYQKLLAEVSRAQDIRSVVALVDAQREWIENTAAANQSKRCFAQMVLNITEYLRGNL